MTRDILHSIGLLIADGKVKVSLHAVDELSKDGLLIEPLIDDFANGIAVEVYPAYNKGPCVLVLQRDETGLPVHLLWGIPAGKTEPAVLLTAYRPDPNQWNDDFMGRKST